MRYIIIDLEATCWERGVSRAQMETIEIGAVRLESSSGPASGEFAAFVRPVASPVLSAFCTQLTSIRQEDVDGAAFFGAVLWDLLSWAGEEPFWLCLWGAYDLGQLRADCERHSMAMPEALERHINLKKHFGRLYGCGPVGMAGALRMCGLPLEGTHHRGIDDARNIARLATRILPALEREGLAAEA